MMVGEELSSTDLHLANGDTLLVGQVAEVEQVDTLDASAVNRPHYRKLQVSVEARETVTHGQTSGYLPVFRGSPTH